MKITNVTPFILRHELPKPFGFSQRWYRARTAGLVRAETDAGVVGWGESWGPPEPMAATVESVLKPMILGEDPFDSEKLWERMYNLTKDYGQKGLIIGAISAIDIALWDIKGKSVGLPVHKLLGGSFRETIKPYASGLYMTDPPQSDKDLADEALQSLTEGFTMLKMKIGFGPDTDLRRVKAVRQAVGDGVSLMVDANHAYDARTAIQLGKRLEEHNILWFEEPVPPENIDGYVEVKAALNIAIASGEAEFTKFGFKELISRRAVDIIQPDVSLSGGFTECKKIAALAQTWCTACIPHVWGSAVGLAAGLQFVASLPNFPDYLWFDKPVLEVDRSPNPFRDELAKEPVLVLNKGQVHIPSKAGLGVEIDEKTLNKYRQRV